MIHRLLGGINPSEYCLISRDKHDSEVSESGRALRLPARYYHLPPESQFRRGYRFGSGRVHESFNVPWGIVMRAGRIARILKREGCRAIVACSGSLLDLPASFLASRWAGIPFYPYYFDYYAYQHVDPTAHFFARRFEPIFMKGASGVIVPNEILGEALEERYGVKATLIRNPCDPAEYEGLPDHTSVSFNGEMSVVYTGAIYDAHYDAFRNLLAAIKLTGRSDVKLHIYSGSEVDWEGEGIRGDALVRHEHQTLSAARRIQRNADLLFLPLAFKSPYPELVRTSATSKLGEYLATRRPVLVHAPADSFVSWYVRQHECGLVVDEQSPERLAQAIERLSNDASLRRRLGARAWERAKADFQVSVAQAEFAGLLGLDLARTAQAEQVLAAS